MIQCPKQKNGEKKRLVFECFFAVMVILLVSAYLFGITFLDIPKENSRVVDTVLGFLLGSVVSPIIIWAFKNAKSTVDQQNKAVHPKVSIRSKGEK